MHDHNKNGRHKRMIWMMIPCLLLLGVLFLNGGELSSSGYLWLILIGVCVIPYIWMMFKRHGGHGRHEDTDMTEKADTTSEKQSGEKNKHKHGGCCH
ncbi:MAG: hypothetical protein AAB815_02675 [Patescibacteria group bacterium]